MDRARSRIDFWTATAYTPSGEWQQVFLNYGHLPSALSVSNYGFVAHRGILGADRTARRATANMPPGEHIVLHLNLFGPKQGERDGRLLKLQQRIIAWRLGQTSKFTIRGADGGPTPKTMLLLRVSALEEEDVSSWRLGRAMRGETISIQNECDAAAVLVDVCQAAIGAFSTSLAEDEARLEEILDHPTGPESVALRLRVVEKDILDRCLDWARHRQEIYSCRRDREPRLQGDLRYV